MMCLRNVPWLLILWATNAWFWFVCFYSPPTFLSDNVSWKHKGCVQLLLYCSGYTLYLQWHRQGHPKKQSDQCPAGVIKAETAVSGVWKSQRDSFLHQRSSGGSGKAQTQNIKVWDRHWCCCITGHSKTPMQREKRRLWIVQGCFLTLLAFVLALSELWGFSAQRGRVWIGLNMRFRHLYA